MCHEKASYDSLRGFLSLSKTMFTLEAFLLTEEFSEQGKEIESARMTLRMDQRVDSQPAPPAIINSHRNH